VSINKLITCMHCGAKARVNRNARHLCRKCLALEKTREKSL